MNINIVIYIVKNPFYKRKELSVFFIKSELGGRFKLEILEILL